MTALARYQRRGTIANERGTIVIVRPQELREET